MPVGVLFSVISAVLANFSPYVASAGLTRSDAGTLLMTVPVAGIVGKLAFGYAADKLSKKLLLLAARQAGSSSHPLDSLKQNS